MATVLTIATDYSRYPGPRFEEDGPFSGQLFRDAHLVPALEKARLSGDKLIVDLDGARGYTASFLEEAFGGLIRERGFSKDQLSRLLEVRAREKRVAYWKDRIAQYLDSAASVSEKRT